MRGLMIGAVLLLLTACGDTVTAPEAEIRTVVARAQAAAEARNASELRALIAEDYLDAQGHDRKTIEQLIRLQLFRNQSIHVVTRVRTMEFPEPERALVMVMAALAGQPVTSIDQLAGLNANIYRFDLELIRQGKDDWRVRHAAWQPAALADFW